MKTKDKFLVGILLLAFFIICTASITHKSITNDELTHIASGYSYLKTFDFRMNLEHPPLMKILSGIPLLFLNPELPQGLSWKQSGQWMFGHKFLFEANTNADQLIFWSRIPMILVALLLGFYVFKWASELYNKKAGYTALILYLFSPLIIAHSRLVTTDVGVGAFMFIALYYFWKFCQIPSHKYLILTGIMVGLTFSAKFTGVYIIPMIGLLAAIRQWKETKDLKKCLTSKSTRKMILSLAIIFGFAVAILMLTYGILEFPKYFDGFRHVVVHSEIGHRAYLFGEHSQEGFWYYFLAAFLFKTPIPVFIFILASIALYKWLKHDNYQELFLVIPLAIYLLAFMINKINIGIRHIIPIYAFLFVLVSKVSTWKFKYKTILGIALLCWYVFIAFSIYPHYLSYFNEFAGGPENGHRILIDSNIDWGQDLKGLKEWTVNRDIPKINIAYFGHDDRKYRNLDYKVLDCGPSQGLMAVSVNRLVGFNKEESKCLAWLRESKTIKPIDNIGNSIYIYNVTESDYLESLTLVCKEGCEQNCENRNLNFSKSEYKSDKCLCECSA